MNKYGFGVWPWLLAGMTTLAALLAFIFRKKGSRYTINTDL